MKVQNLDNKTEKKGKARKAQRDRALQKRIMVRKARLIAHKISQKEIAEKFKCTEGYVSHVISEDCNSVLAKIIRAYISKLKLPAEFDVGGL